MIIPLFNPDDDEWVVLVGRYILNMGALEMATRLIIARIEGTDCEPIFTDDLSARIGFVRKHFPREDQARHKWAMNALDIASRHAGFRNIIAHGPLAITRRSDGTYHINGIVNVAPKDPDNIAQLVTLEELKGRVNESAVVAKLVLEMQTDFNVIASG